MPLPMADASPTRFGAWGSSLAGSSITNPPPSASGTSTNQSVLPTPSPPGGDSSTGSTPSSGNYGGMGATEYSGPNGGRWNSASGSVVAPWGPGAPSPDSGWSKTFPGGYGSKSGNGGSYGVGGQGPDLTAGHETVAFGGGGAGMLPQGPGGNEGGTMSFDDGGSVDPESEGGDAPTMDPMSIIQNALAMGRQSMGLPAKFTDQAPSQPPVSDNDSDDQQQGFDDGGGVLPEQGQEDQGTGGSLPDPRKTMAYLAGAGAVSPDVATALEQKVDPQGQMDPAERKLKAITSAPTPQAQFGLMQHYRTLFNGHSAAAQVALDQGNMAQAAQHATAAMAHVPTGHSVKFAPTRGGLVAQASKIGQQQGFAEGGAVDTDNPVVVMKGYDGGGIVDKAASPLLQAPDMMEDSAPDQGVIPTGQEDNTDQEDTQEPVIPNSVEGNPVSDVAQTAPEQAEPEAPAAPTFLPGKAMRNILMGGWDKLVEGGRSILDFLKQPAPPDTTTGLPGAVNTGADAIRQGIGGAVSGVNAGLNWLTGSNGGQAPDVQAATEAEQPQPAAPSPTPTPPTPNAPAARGNGLPAPGTAEWRQNYDKNAAAMVQRNKAFQGGQQAAPQGGANQDPQGALMQTLQKRAAILFPHSDQGAQRSTYVAKQLDLAEERQNKLDVSNTVWGNKAQIAQGAQTARGAQQSAQDDRRDARQDKSLAGKIQLMQISVAGRAATAAQSDFVRARGQELAANPSLASDPEALLKHLTQYRAQMNQLGVTPRDIMQNLQRAQQGGDTGQTGQQLPTVTDKAGYDALESGTSFVDAKGKTWRKP